MPLLTLGFGLDLRSAVGVRRLRDHDQQRGGRRHLEKHLANLQLGIGLELFTAIGALVGRSIAFLIDERILSGLFALLLGYSRRLDDPRRSARHGWGR